MPHDGVGEFFCRRGGTCALAVRIAVHIVIPGRIAGNLARKRYPVVLGDELGIQLKSLAAVVEETVNEDVIDEDTSDDDEE